MKTEPRKTCQTLRLSLASWQNSISLRPAPFCTPRPNLPVTPGVYWLSTFALKRIFCGSLEFLCVSLGMPFRPFLKTEFTWATSRDKSMSHQDTGLFTVAIKAKDLLSSVFLSCKANPLHVPHPSVFIVTPVWSLGAKETLAIMLKLNLLLAPWVIKSVVSGVPYLLPLLRQKQHIHCKQGKIKSQFLQVCITSVTAN